MHQAALDNNLTGSPEWEAYLYSTIRQGTRRTAGDSQAAELIYIENFLAAHAWPARKHPPIKKNVVRKREKKGEKGRKREKKGERQSKVNCFAKGGRSAGFMDCCIGGTHVPINPPPTNSSIQSFGDIACVSSYGDDS